jgi:hypothetical protein
MKEVHQEAEVALIKAQEEMRRYADLDQREAPEYKPGDKVMITIENLATDRPSRKLAERQIGPYVIEKVLSPNAVLLKLPANIRISPKINVSRIHPYTAPTPGQQAKLQPSISVDNNGTPRYEVQEILNSRLRRGKLEYLIKWKGYTNENNTWEPEANVDGAEQALKDFHKSHPSAPHKINATLFESLVFRSYHNFTIPNRVPSSRLNLDFDEALLSLSSTSSEN